MPEASDVKIPAIGYQHVSNYDKR